MDKAIKSILLFFFLFLVSAPFLFLLFHRESILRLDGYVVPSAKPNISLEGFLNRSYQDSYEKYINDNIGFRPFFVRLRNQISFSLFDNVNAAGVIRGKENYLFEENYLLAYNGSNYIGYDSVEHHVAGLKKLQNVLAERGKTLLVCLAPGKGSFYSEYFPDEYVMPATDSTNYKVYASTLIAQGVNTIDFNRWMLDARDTCSCMMYPKYGIHWSRYAELIAADSIIRRIEYLRSIDMSGLEIYDIERTENLQNSDYDIAKGMNLLFQLPSPPMCYPKIRWQSGDSLIRPKVIVISDSFYWGIFNTGISSTSFSEGEFWYYNQQAYPQSFAIETKISELDIPSKLAVTDVFVLICTEANLHKFDWGLSQMLLLALNAE